MTQRPSQTISIASTAGFLSWNCKRIERFIATLLKKERTVSQMAPRARQEIRIRSDRGRTYLHAFKINNISKIFLESMKRIARLDSLQRDGKVVQRLYL